MSEIPRNSEENHEEEKPKEIRDAQNFDELFYVLDEKGKIIGGHKEYSAEELKKRINDTILDFHSHAIDEETDPLEQMQLIKKELGAITRTDGLRDKVSELLYKSIEEMTEYMHKKRRESNEK
jgi:hypothetical protein